MKKFLLVNFTILFLTFFMRMYGLVWTLPYLLDGDEWRVINSGLTLYYVDDKANYPEFFLEGYPPYRLWETVFIKVLNFPPQDDSLNLAQQVFIGRYFSVLYSMLTAALIFQLAKSVSGKREAGIIAASFFAVWTDSMRFGQLVLADSPALMGMVACLWFYVRYVQRKNINLLRISLLLGLFTVFAKYNLGLVLILPCISVVSTMRHQPQATLRQVILPSVIILLVLIGFSRPIVDNDSLACYFKINRQVSCWQSIDTNIHTNTISFPERLMTNFSFIYDWLSVWIMFGGGLGFIWLWKYSEPNERRIYTWLLFLALTNYGMISLFQATAARQMMGVMLIVLIFFASVIAHVPPRFKLLIHSGFILLLAFETSISLKQNADHYQPDSRVATVEWFVNHAPPNSEIGTEPILYEFGELNGYSGKKNFGILHIPNISTQSPTEWNCQGYDYLVVEDNLDRIHRYVEQYQSEIAQVIIFVDHNYMGPTRVIMDLEPQNCK